MKIESVKSPNTKLVAIRAGQFALTGYRSMLKTKMYATDMVLSSLSTAAKKEKQDKVMMGGTVALSVVLAVGIFMVLPYVLSSLLKPLTNVSLNSNVAIQLSSIFCQLLNSYNYLKKAPNKYIIKLTVN